MMFVLKTIGKYLHRTKHKVLRFSSNQSVASPIVTVKQGKLKGSVKKLLDGTSYYSFKGIPYAEPPVGELRFKAPLPVKPWEGIREAIEHGSVCPQWDMNSVQLVEGNEDCLFLNVYTKSLEPNSKTPVLVYIHGGAFMSGSGDTDTFGPEFIFQHDVLLVTMNYRLEVLGFLSLETPDVPGNAGLKDQVVALHWVKENIAKFGGNPENIILFGESAGGACVTYHMLSQMSKGLFHKAIVQSGAALADWAMGHESVERAFRLGKLLGKRTNDKNELLQFLQSVPAIELAGVTRKTRTSYELISGYPCYFAPVVEKKFYGVNPFMTENPISVLLEGKITRVPLLAGYNSMEGILMVSSQLKKNKINNEQPSCLVPRQINLNVSKDKLLEFGERIKSFYVGEGEFENQTIKAIANLQTDLNFSYPVYRFINLYCKYANVYMYRFDYDTDLNVMKASLGLNLKGACHADDLFYLFYNKINKEFYNNQEKLQKIIYQLTKLWADFAKTGNPTPNAEVVNWPQYTVSGQECMLLNEQLSVKNDVDKDRMEFWNELYCDAGLPYKI